LGKFAKFSCVKRASVWVLSGYEKIDEKKYLANFRDFDFA